MKIMKIVFWPSDWRIHFQLFRKNGSGISQERNYGMSPQVNRLLFSGVSNWIEVTLEMILAFPCQRSDCPSLSPHFLQLNHKHLNITSPFSPSRCFHEQRIKRLNIWCITARGKAETWIFNRLVWIVELVLERLKLCTSQSSRTFYKGSWWKTSLVWSWLYFTYCDEEVSSHVLRTLKDFL